MKRCFLFLFLAFFLISRQIFASDQKLAHGAGTLPHLTHTFTLSLGLENPTPLLYALQYDIGLGTRVQLGFLASVLVFINTIEINSMFNVLKTANDSDFLSLYFNPGINIVVLYGFGILTLRTGIAYEHRFGDKRRFGIYTKIGVLMRLYDEVPTLDWRVGFQALLTKRFSITLEPMLQWTPPPYPLLLPGGKVALTWAFERRVE